eukprot:7614257-Pyramimonas_sp.AAC.1
MHSAQLRALLVAVVLRVWLLGRSVAANVGFASVVWGQRCWCRGCCLGLSGLWCGVGVAVVRLPGIL